ncbi:MAG: lytic transglycosylase domain-containing protein [Clostridia bacterium]|nr:lytic transglycosylase domain-containing protein [Clostridia bacterium]
MYIIKELNNNKYVVLSPSVNGKKKISYSYFAEEAYHFESKQDAKKCCTALNGKFTDKHFQVKNQDINNRKLFISAIIVGYAFILLLLISILALSSKSGKNNIDVSVKNSENVTINVNTLPSPLPPEERLAKLLNDPNEDEIIAAVIAYNDKNCNIPIQDIMAFIFTESGKDDFNGMIFSGKVNHMARSKKNCLGLMQLSQEAVDEFNWKTGNNYAHLDMLDIAKNIEVGCWYAFERYEGLYDSAEDAYILYNAGPGNVRKNGYDYYRNYASTKRFNTLREKIYELY